jgi:hypothetical protein
VTTDLRLTRRSTLQLAGTGALAVIAIRSSQMLAIAQDATPSTGTAFAGLGLPELNITMTDTGFEGIQSELAAGQSVVHATYTGSQSGTLQFMQLPEGMSSSDVLASLGAGGASPAAGAGGPQDWFYTVYMPGGVALGASQSASFVIDLQPGNYMVWAEDPSAPQAPFDFTVTGDTAAPTAGTTPQSNVTINEVATSNGFAFEIQGGLGAGSQVVAVTNNSDQPHFVEVDGLPADTTREDIDNLFRSFLTGTPTAGGLSQGDVRPVYFVGTQSTNTTQWHEISLDAGTYLLTCWVSDIARGGVPHALEGMYDVVTAGGGAAATPTS